MRGGGATAVRDGPGEERRRRMFWEIAFEMKRGFFPRAPGFFVGLFFSLSKLFQSVWFSFSLLESGTDPNRPAFYVPSRYSTLGSGGGGGGLVAWTLRSSPASPPRGEYCFYYPRFLFVNISQCPTGGINSSLIFLPV